jgi:hypothetical protein
MSYYRLHCALLKAKYLAIFNTYEMSLDFPLPTGGEG